MIKTPLCTTVTLAACCGLLFAADAFTGMWTLDVATSTFAAGNPAPKELTLTFTVDGGSRTQVLTGIAADGRAISTAWRAPILGGTATFPAGQGPNGGASVNVVDGNTLVMTQNHRNGTAGASRTYTVSADGKTLTLTQRGEDGQEWAKMVFRRP